jgi:hypothetical protein
MMISKPLRLAAAASAAVVAVTLAGCGAQSGAEAEAAFVGTWVVESMSSEDEELTSEDLELIGGDQAVTLTMSKDGTFELKLFSEEMQEGTWKAKSATEAAFTVDGEDAKATLRGGKLTLAVDTEEIVFVRGEITEPSAPAEGEDGEDQEDQADQDTNADDDDEGGQETEGPLAQGGETVNVDDDGYSFTVPEGWVLLDDSFYTMTEEGAESLSERPEIYFTYFPGSTAEDRAAQYAANFGDPAPEVTDQVVGGKEAKCYEVPDFLGTGLIHCFTAANSGADSLAVRGHITLDNPAYQAVWDSLAFS